MSGGSELQIMIACFDAYDYWFHQIMSDIQFRGPGDKVKGWG